MERRVTLHFDGWTLDPRSGELSRDGLRVRLQRQPQLILEQLLARPGEVVTRAELTAHLWPRVVVEFDTALNSAVRRLRTALNDDPDQPRYIETVPRRGYRYIGPPPVPATGPAERSPDIVRPAPTDLHAGLPKPLRPPLLRWGPVALIGLVVLGAAAWRGDMRQADEVNAAAVPESRPHAVPPSLAVLPFAELEPRGDQGALARGLAEEVLSVLGQVQGLRVTASDSSFAFPPAGADLTGIARRLDVTHVLEGSMRRSEDRVFVSAGLFEASTRSRVWTRDYERRVDDMPDLRAEIAADVAHHFRLAPASPADRPIHGEAYERYVLARHLFRRRGTGDVEAALRRFSEVVVLQPDFAAAWAGLASACWIETVEGRMDPDVGLARMREAAERALALDPRLSEAHLRLALFHRRSGDPRLADEHVRLALEAEPNDPLALLFASGRALRDGRLEEAVALHRQAVTADPLSAATRHNLAWLLFRAGRTDEARSEAVELLELYPGHDDTSSVLCLVLAAAGRHAEALAVDQHVPSTALARSHCRALALSGLGRTEDAEAALDVFVRVPDAQAALQVAEFYAQSGDFDRAFDWLRRAVQRDTDRDEAWMIRESPLLRPLRQDARWDALLASTASGRA